MTVPLRTALYLRVSTARQAEHDVSIPDQHRQGEAYCAARGYQLDGAVRLAIDQRSGLTTVLSGPVSTSCAISACVRAECSPDQGGE